jgi:hypothetical protein
MKKRKIKEDLTYLAQICRHIRYDISLMLDQSIVDKTPAHDADAEGGIGYLEVMQELTMLQERFDALCEHLGVDVVSGAEFGDVTSVTVKGKK